MASSPMWSSYASDGQDQTLSLDAGMLLFSLLFLLLIFDFLSLVSTLSLKHMMSLVQTLSLDVGILSFCLFFLLLMFISFR